MAMTAEIKNRMPSQPSMNNTRPPTVQIRGQPVNQIVPGIRAAVEEDERQPMEVADTNFHLLLLQYRTQAMEIIMEELTYDKNILFPFLQALDKPKLKMDMIVQYFQKYLSKAYISLHSTENKEDIDDNSLPEICKNMISAFTCLKKTDEHTAIPPFGKEALFT
ncbi:hypothetical protein L2E82_16996 [Cichorium intybus]|uniref:Uncharacterized protein n=1 Tax=Cichorium intybus TaxID=13427 RepID=A0ACB9F8D1_CICIN|nr:hypothetical protein L2E82_16996 [Cichorium intybus]